MGKQFTVTGVPADASLPNSGMYTIGNVITLTDLQFADLPSWYSQYCSGLSTVADPVHESAPYNTAATDNTTYAALNGTLASIVRDGAGRVTSYVDNGVTMTVTYDGTGRVATITAVGTTRTVSYAAASGLVTGVN